MGAHTLIVPNSIIHLLSVNTGRMSSNLEGNLFWLTINGAEFSFPHQDRSVARATPNYYVTIDIRTARSKPVDSLKASRSVTTVLSHKLCSLAAGSLGNRLQKIDSTSGYTDPKSADRIRTVGVPIALANCPTTLHG
jgi:hypothetical protein